MNHRFGVTMPTVRNAFGMTSGFIIDPPNRLKARMMGAPRAPAWLRLRTRAWKRAKNAAVQKAATAASSKK
jgi:hypothetical protein